MLPLSVSVKNRKYAVATAILFAICSSELLAIEEEEGEDSSVGLPEKYSQNYLIAATTISPSKKFAVIYPTDDPADFPDRADFIVSLQPFAVLGKLETKRPYFRHESHGGLSADWSDESSVALITLDIKWGPGDIFVVEFAHGKITRTTNLLARMHDVLAPDFRQAKAEPYNDSYDFIFESEEEPSCQLEGHREVRINALATTDPKGAADGHVWEGRLEANWDIKGAKFTTEKATRVFAGVREHQD